MKPRFVPILSLGLIAASACGTGPTLEGAAFSSESAGAGGADPETGSAGACQVHHFATNVVDYEFGEGQDFGQTEFPENILGPPEGGGAEQGSLHVTSLGNGGWVILSFERTRIVDGPGADFIVFENAFYPGGDSERVFAELATVSVSEDGRNFVEFECSAVAAPFGDCAGWHPVLANAETNHIDPLDPEAAGGDAYDLSEIGVQAARFVKITDRADLTGSDGVFDLDAVAIVHGVCE